MLTTLPCGLRDNGTGDKIGHLDGRDFHDPESFVTGLVYFLDVLPPEIENGENYRMRPRDNSRRREEDG